MTAAVPVQAPEPTGVPDRSYRGTRLFDLAALVALAPLVVPVAAIVALAVIVTDGRPVLFRQERIGLGGAPFTMVKFRTMTVGDNPLVPDDDRITPVGRLLRRLSLDELPQLWNVLVGDMSLVGPRPTVASQVARYSPRQRGRLAVRPGLTGLAQVSGRNRLPWAERIELDLAYVGDQSVRTDLALVARTFRVLVTGDGVDGHPLDDPFVTTASPGHEERSGTGDGGAT